MHAPPKRLRLAVGVKKRKGGSADDGSKQLKSKDKVGKYSYAVRQRRLLFVG